MLWDATDVRCRCVHLHFIEAVEADRCVHLPHHVRGKVSVSGRLLRIVWGMLERGACAEASTQVIPLWCSDPLGSDRGNPFAAAWPLRAGAYRRLAVTGLDQAVSYVPARCRLVLF